MAQHMRDRLGRFGVWRTASQVTPDLAAALEELGFGTLWLGSSPSGDLIQAEELLEATTTLTVATGIVNIWQCDAHDVAASFARIEARHPGRFLLGVGAGHREATQQYAKPYDTLAGYVDVLLGDGVPAQSLVLAALGPKVLRLAAERTAGAHPYLVTPEYTRQARALLGAGPLLAPERKRQRRAHRRPRRARRCRRGGGATYRAPEGRRRPRVDPVAHRSWHRPGARLPAARGGAGTVTGRRHGLVS